MDNLVTLSPTRSSFSISTDSTIHRPAIPQPEITGRNEDSREQAFKQAVAQLPLDGYPEPAMTAYSQLDAGNTGCVECMILLKHLVAVIDQFPQPKLQGAVLYHYKHHEPLVPMQYHFRELAANLVEAVEWKKKYGAQDMEMEGDFDCGEFFDFDKYAPSEGADVHLERSAPVLSKPVHTQAASLASLPDQEKEVDDDSLTPDVSSKEQITKWLTGVVNSGSNEHGAD
jgi:hypothetical protein